MRGAPLRSVPGQSGLTGRSAIGCLRDDYYDARIHDLTNAEAQTYETQEGRFVRNCWMTLVPYVSDAFLTILPDAWLTLTRVTSLALLYAREAGRTK